MLMEEVAKAFDILAQHGLLYGGTPLRPRRVIHAWFSGTYIVIKYDDGGTQYIDKRRRLTVNVPTQMAEEVVDVLNVLAQHGLLYVNGRRVAAVRHVGGYIAAVLDDGKARRVKQLVVQLPP
jgi:hypothetical protein